MTGPLHANNGDLLAQGAEADMGIALLPLFIVDKALAEGRLVQVLKDWEAPPISIHAVYPTARRIPLKTRAFWTFSPLSSGFRRLQRYLRYDSCDAKRVAPEGHTTLGFGVKAGALKTRALPGDSQTGKQYSEQPGELCFLQRPFRMHY